MAKGARQPAIEMTKVFLQVFVALCLGWTGMARADEPFLDPARAFALTAQRLDAQRLELRFDVAPGYYLYRDKFAAAAPGVALGPLSSPPGQVKFDENFGKEVETLRGTVRVVVPVPAPAPAVATTFLVQVTNQGCADRGLCYPPQERPVTVETGPDGLVRVAHTPPPEPRAGGLLGALGLTGGSPAATTSPAPAAATPAATATTGAAEAGGNDAAFTAALQSRNLVTIAGAFLLAGLLLSFTPCVLPMVPILSSIIVGQGERVSRGRGFSLALAYALGMALVYTAFGVAAALVGEGLGPALQNAWVLGAFAVLLVVLSLSMFGAYELQVPAGLQARLTHASNRLTGGRHLAVFAMGGLSAVIVGPCVAAPLAGALVYIGQTGDTVLGGLALFAMAMGMSVPLLLVGLSAGTVLPRSGAWMRQVKHVFGFLLLAVALWMVVPVVPAWSVMVGVAVLAAAGAVFLGAFEPLPAQGAHPARAMAKGMGLVLALAGAVQLVGAASGGRSVLQPLRHLAAASPAGGAAGASALAAEHGGLRFVPVSDLAGLDAAVRASTRPVMLDVYADWCVACKEFEAFTLTDAAVQARLAGMTLLRVDVTAHNDADKALLRRHGLFGPPALLFFPPGGAEVPGARVIGFQNASTFLAHLARIAPLVGAP